MIDLDHRYWLFAWCDSIKQGGLGDIGFTSDSKDIIAKFIKVLVGMDTIEVFDAENREYITGEFLR